MSDFDDIPIEEPSAEELAALGALLNDPALWARPSAHVGDDVVAAITAEARPTPRLPADPRSAVPAEPWPPAVTAEAPPAGRAPSTSPPPPEDRRLPTVRPEPVSLDERRARRDERRRRPRWVGPALAAAMVAGVALGALGAVELQGRPGGETLALAGGNHAPGASAVAHIDDQPNGVRIVLDVRNLGPAPPGTFYAAWVVREEPRNRVGVGTFHLRGGDGTIELWSGVSMDDYPILSVTLQQETDPTGPGDAILRGRLGG